MAQGQMIVRRNLQNPGIIARVIGFVSAPFRRALYEAASVGRATRGWRRSNASAERATRENKPIREVARSLVRNNPWAKRGVQVIGNHAVGWGITPRGLTPDTSAAWKAWSESVSCDIAGRKTFPAIQRLVCDAMVTDGDVFVVRRIVDDMRSPLRLQVLEADYLDTTKESYKPASDGSRIVQGIEFDALGRRVAYWFYKDHPGSDYGGTESVRTPAEDVIHVFREDRPGQIRGISSLAAAVARLSTFDEYESAQLMRAKVAACFSVFVRDVDGTGSPFGDVDDDDDRVEKLEPGMISYLAPGQDVSFAAPPSMADSESQFTKTTLRSIAAALGVTYEDLTGDYSQANFSTIRIGRLSHWATIRDIQNHVLIPLLCERVFDWFTSVGMVIGTVSAQERPQWTPPPMPLTDPEKEAQAYKTMIRTGAMTHDEMVAEMGEDPSTHWSKYSEGLSRLDALGIVLDSDARKTTNGGQIQIEPVAQEVSDV